MKLVTWTPCASMCTWYLASFWPIRGFHFIHMYVLTHHTIYFKVWRINMVILYFSPHALVSNKRTSTNVALNLCSILRDSKKIISSCGLAYLSFSICNWLGKPRPILVDESTVLLPLALWLKVVFLTPKVIFRMVLAYFWCNLSRYNFDAIHIAFKLHAALSDFVTNGDLLAWGRLRTPRYKGG